MTAIFIIVNWWYWTNSFQESLLLKIQLRTQPDFLTRQPKRPLTNDIIAPAIDSHHYFTDANIDASCNRTHYGSNWMVCVGKSISTFYNWLLTMTNTRITPWITVQGKGSARTAPRHGISTLLNTLFGRITRSMPFLMTVVRYQR